MDESGFPASENVPGQEKSRRAYREFEENHGQCTWWAEYVQLRHEGWKWRVAAYIAWAASPVGNRWPETQAALATDVLGLRSDRVIRTWRKKRPEIDERIGILQVAPLVKHRRDVIEALIAVACDPNPKSHSDRKLFLEMTKDYKPREGAIAVAAAGARADASADVCRDLSELSDDELDLLIENLE